MSELTLADIESQLKRLAKLTTDLSQEVTASNLERANLEHRVEALEKRLGASEER